MCSFAYIQSLIQVTFRYYGKEACYLGYHSFKGIIPTEFYLHTCWIVTLARLGWTPPTRSDSSLVAFILFDVLLVIIEVTWGRLTCRQNQVGEKDTVECNKSTAKEWCFSFNTELFNVRCLCFRKHFSFVLLFIVFDKYLLNG